MAAGFYCIGTSLGACVAADMSAHYLSLFLTNLPSPELFCTSDLTSVGEADRQNPLWVNIMAHKARQSLVRSCVWAVSINACLVVFDAQMLGLSVFSDTEAMEVFS